MKQTDKKTEDATRVPRPPVVVVMGHIDHGKSTLLDYIRKTNVAAKEAGGITQHLNAYEIEHADESGAKRRITFIDTPGHAAFALMRERGAQVADIAVLVVAADDGVKAQTIEVLATIRASAVPFIVAINKVDKENADPERVKQQLAEQNVFVEGYGGDVPVVPLSAKTGDGIPLLLDMILLVADLHGETGTRSAAAEGVVIEAHRDARTGVSAMLIIKNGTLAKGMFVAAGESVAGTRRIENFLGDEIASATFSSPVRLYGFSAPPHAGALFKAFRTEREAEAYAEENRERKQPKQKPAASASAASEDIARVPIVVKADALGSLEAIEHEIKNIAAERVEPYVLDAGIGSIGETDIQRAMGDEKALVIGFNAKIDRSARDLAERNNVPLQTFSVIYELEEWLAAELAKRKPRIVLEETKGAAKIIRVFSSAKNKHVIGGRVTEGTLARGGSIKIMRRDIEISRGEILELQQHKAAADKVETGSEFGARITSTHMPAGGDVLQVVEMVEH
ncbi:MAG: translation initiation factor IF-2 [Parcubacteria group bacterium]|nr:translation initiation factor IF-2 [Parcubacteria group bacterium]